MSPLDLYKADAHRFQIVDGKLMPSLDAIEGLGDKAADAVVAAAKEGTFLSKDDFRMRTKVSKTVIDLMDRYASVRGHSQLQSDVFDGFYLIKKICEQQEEEGMKKEELRYLKCLAELYPTIGAAATEIINLQSIVNLPKGDGAFSGRISTGNTRRFPMCSAMVPAP